MKYIAINATEHDGEFDAYTFDEFVQMGIDSGANIVNNMPWSFEFFGVPVTHENDDLYFVGCMPQLEFNRNEIIAITEDSQIFVWDPDEFFQTFEPAENNQSGSEKVTFKKHCDIENCNAINAGIDPCIQQLVKVLNDGGIKTLASCCGHGNTIGSIVLADGRELLIAPDYETARQVEKHFPDIHGN